MGWDMYGRTNAPRSPDRLGAGPSEEEEEKIGDDEVDGHRGLRWHRGLVREGAVGSVNETGTDRICEAGCEHRA